MHRSLVKIGNHNKVVVVFNQKEDKNAEQPKGMNQKHHIHIYDRSGSMTMSINELVENIKETIKYIPNDDYVSILWFSGEGQYKILIKGAKKDENIFKLLDSTKSTIGCTCFSEVLKETGEIIDELAAICPNYIVNLFTDGRPVVSWGEAEEEKRVYKEISKWVDKVIAINTIGYGYCYNQELLRGISALSMYGVMVHSKYIKEYYSIFTDNYERVVDLVAKGVEVKAEPGVEVMYLTGKSSKMNETAMKLSMLDKKKNQFVLVGDSDFAFEVNGEQYNSADITSEIPKATLTPVLYAYAYEQYYRGNRQVALDVLANVLMDKYLVDEQAKAFTFDECGEFSKKLKKAVYSTAGRLLAGKCSEGYIPADDATCVMDVLRILIGGDSHYAYATNYNRIGLKTVDSFNLFKAKEGDNLTPLNELVFNSDKLNVSIRAKLKGTVELNPIRADKVGLPRVLDVYQYRNQTLIKDGNLNMETITVVVDTSTMAKIEALGIDGLIKSSEDYKEGDFAKSVYKKIVLDFNTIPVINRLYLKGIGEASHVLKNTLALTELEAKQKVLNSCIKKLPKPTKGYTVEQIEVLGEHGVGVDMIYNGVDTKVVEKNESDYYEAREMTFDIKGYTSLPSLNDVIKKIKAGKELTGPSALMGEYLLELQKELDNKAKEPDNGLAKSFNKALAGSTKDVNDTVSLLDDDINFEGAYDFFSKKLAAVKLQILGIRIELSAVKIAKTLTGEWFTGVTSDGNGKYTYSEGDKTLIINTKKVKVYY